jgi:hypothetical protein
MGKREEGKTRWSERLACRLSGVRLVSSIGFAVWVIGGLIAGQGKREAIEAREGGRGEQSVEKFFFGEAKTSTRDAAGQNEDRRPGDMRRFAGPNRCKSYNF